MIHHTVLTEDDLAAVDRLLADADAAQTSSYPGDRTDRQPVHTVYVPADRFHPRLTQEWSAAAVAALVKDAPRAQDLAAATGLHVDEVAAVWARMAAKLESEPIEDLRVDLEDGYGNRHDEEEDRHAIAAGEAVAAAVKAGSAPPFLGVRFKSLEGGTRRRGLRSLDLVLGAMLADAPLPDGWVVTLPKVTSVSQVSAFVDVCGCLERAYGLDDGALGFEIQVETPQAILMSDGTAGVASMVHAAEGRCTGLHFGTYDYTAALGISGGYQAMDHSSADHAKSIMQLAAAGTGVRISDGSTNIIPVGDREEVHSAWALHTRLVRRSLERGFYQGWDLHPAQLPTPFRHDLHVLPRRSGTNRRAPGRIPERGRGRRAGRTGHRPGTGRIPDARSALRRRVDWRGHSTDRCLVGDGGEVGRSASGLTVAQSCDFVSGGP